MARLTSNPHCNCNASFRTDGTLLDRFVPLPQVRPSSEHGSVRAVFLFLGALQMQQAGVTLVSQVLQVEEPDQGDPCTAEDANACYKVPSTPVSSADPVCILRDKLKCNFCSPFLFVSLFCNEFILKCGPSC